MDVADERCANAATLTAWANVSMGNELDIPYELNTHDTDHLVRSLVRPKGYSCGNLQIQIVDVSCYCPKCHRSMSLAENAKKA